MATPEYLEVEVNAERTFIVHKVSISSRIKALLAPIHL
jgi:hypothetical protein